MPLPYQNIPPVTSQSLSLGLMGNGTTCSILQSWPTPPEQPAPLALVVSLSTAPLLTACAVTPPPLPISASALTLGNKDVYLVQRVVSLSLGLAHSQSGFPLAA
jgi:hypothetical protein